MSGTLGGAAAALRDETVVARETATARRAVGEAFAQRLRDSVPRGSGRQSGPATADTVTVEDSGNDTVVSIGGAAVFLESGTREHTIEAVHAGVLHFTMGGQDAFAASVDHPAVEPRPFFTQALDATDADRLLGEAGTRIVDELAAAMERA